MEQETLEMEAFLEYFSKNHRDDNFSTIKYGNYEMKKLDLEGEILDWTLQYLQYMSCPASLEAGLAKAVLDETKLTYLTEDTPDGSGKVVSGKKAITSLSLLQNVTVTVNEVCRRLKKEENYRKSFFRSKNLYPCSVCAIRNGRKKMEDRHILIHDLNAVFDLRQRNNNNSTEGADEGLRNGGDDDRASFYGVFDGHVGKDAAAFTAAHLHQFLIQSEHFPLDPVKATYEAFHRTNVSYEQNKAQSCGSTVVFTLILGRKMYIAWLGDSQVLLVRNGRPVKVVTPHKPERKDERERIVNAGGTVLFYGQWRVNGLLAVSRSIGDFEHKSFISAEPDVTSVEMNDTEDFVILASDGLWDNVSHEKVTTAIFKHLEKHAKANGEIEKLSSELANLAKAHGSVDNISIIVIFLKPVSQLIEEHSRRSEVSEEETSEVDDEDVNVQKQYSGISSTCKYISQIMSTGEETTLLTPGVKDGAFSSPGGGGMTFGVNFSPDGRMNDPDESEEQFRRASDSMFKEGSDFMSNNSSINNSVDTTWIQQGGSNSSSSAANNPFLGDMSLMRKPDSGFISPACNSSNKSSDEDRKEDEEFLESQEVSKLLGGRPMEELLARDTPTPPVDETVIVGSSLEEILAAARDNPDSVGEIDDDDSDESSTDDSKPPLKDFNSNPPANQNVSDSDENEEGDFTFVKESGGPQNHLEEGAVKESSNKPAAAGAIPSEISNGHHTSEEEEEGPASVIIESQETPNPDSASFILKTSNSEAPDLPSPLEPVVEMIMEPEGVGNASPILEETEEDYPHHSKPKVTKETSELECEGDEKGSPPLLDSSTLMPPMDGHEVVEEVIEAKVGSSVGGPGTYNQQVVMEGKECENGMEKEPKGVEAVFDDDIQLLDGKAEEEPLPQDAVSNGKKSPSEEEDLEPPVEYANPAAADDPLIQVDEQKENATEKDSSEMEDIIIPKEEIPLDAAPVGAVEDELMKSEDHGDKEALIIETEAPSVEEITEVEPMNEEDIQDDKTQTPAVEEPKIDEKLIEEECISEKSMDEIPCTEVIEEPKIAAPTHAVEDVGKPAIETEVAESTTQASTSEVLDKEEEIATIGEKAESHEEEAKDTPKKEEGVEVTTTPSEDVPKQQEAVIDSVEKVVDSKTTESSSKASSPKKSSGMKKPLPSTTKSASSSPKKTTTSSSNTAKSTTLSRRPASATKTSSTVSKTTPKTTGTASSAAKPSSASRVSSMSKTATAQVSSKVSSTRPASAKTTSTTSSLSRKTTTTTSVRTTPSGTTSSSSSLRTSSTRPASGEVKSRIDTGKKEPSSKVASTPKPTSRVGAYPKSSTSSSKPNGTASNVAPSRKPLSSRTTTTTTTTSSSTASTKKTTTSTVAKSGVASRSSLPGGGKSLGSSSSAKTTTGGVSAPRKPGSNVSAKVSTGLTRPKSSSVKAPAKPTENGGPVVNGNEAAPVKEEVVAAAP